MCSVYVQRRPIPNLQINSLYIYMYSYHENSVIIRACCVMRLNTRHFPSFIVVNPCQSLWVSKACRHALKGKNLKKRRFQHHRPHEAPRAAGAEACPTTIGAARFGQPLYEPLYVLPSEASYSTEELVNINHCIPMLDGTIHRVKSPFFSAKVGLGWGMVWGMELIK